MTCHTVLVVEDEFETAELLRMQLSAAGHDVRVVATGAAATEAINRFPVSLVVVNSTLTDIDGVDLCRKLRVRPDTRTVPLLIVSAHDDEAEVVEALDIGVDDFMVKPIRPSVFLARVRAVLRRAHGISSDEARSPLVIDPLRHTAILSGEPLVLTLTQFRILQYLASQSGIVRSRNDVVTAVHGNKTVLSDRAIDVHVAALRQKMGPHGSLIETVRGVGYRLAQGNDVWVSRTQEQQTQDGATRVVAAPKKQPANARVAAIV